MKTSFNFLAIALMLVLAMVLGILFGWNTHTYNFNVEGFLQYAPASHLSVSYPVPSGYYLECEVFGMVYLSHRNINDFLGKKISARGRISEIKGRDTQPVFPLLILSSIKEVK